MTSTAGIIGGGALGLAAALRLAESGVSVTVLEREPQLGGLAAGFRPAGEAFSYLEKFYHHLFRSDRTAIRLVRQLGLESRLIWRQPVTATLRGGRLYPMTPMGMLQFSEIPLRDRLRLVAAVGVLKLAPNERPFLHSTAERWSRRWAGRRVDDALLGPLLRGKFGDRAPEIAMSWLWSRFHERSLALGYLDGGFQLLYEAIGDRIRSLGGRIDLGVSAESITTSDGGIAVETDSGRLAFDRLLVTVPQHVFRRLAPELDAAYFDAYPGPDFYSAHVVILALDRPLTGAYWINVADAGYPFLVLVEHTNFIDAGEYGGMHLVYLGNYLRPDHALFSRTDEEAAAEFLPVLRRFNPAFDASWVQRSWVFQAPFAQPIVTSGYPSRLPPHQTPLPGVLFASMAHVYPQDRGQNYSLALGERMAGSILQDLAAARG
jgi:protoporphyrinogen oxidase